MRKFLLLSLAFTVFLTGCFNGAVQEPTKETVFCATDAKVCSDGSSVGRVAPDCEFAACPTPNPTTMADTIALTDFPTTDCLVAGPLQTACPVVGDTVAHFTTSEGDIWIKLFPEQTPKTVENFTGLVERGYYDGLIFHRVIPNFMIQGGDPTGTGTGGKSIWGKDFTDEFTPQLSNLRGALSMANRGANTNGSQFFIVQAEDGTPWLDGKHTVFGQVFAGLETVDTIATVERGALDKPITDVVLEKVEVFEVADK